MSAWFGSSICQRLKGCHAGVPFFSSHDSGIVAFAKDSRDAMQGL